MSPCEGINKNEKNKDTAHLEYCSLCPVEYSQSTPGWQTSFWNLYNVCEGVWQVMTCWFVFCHLMSTLGLINFLLRIHQ